MSKQKSKTGILKRIKTEHRLLERDLAKFAEQDMARQGVVGEWSIKDVLAHLMAWERLLLDWYESGLRGVAPLVPPVGLGAREIAALNQQIYERYREWPLADVLAESHAMYLKTVATIEAIPQADMFAAGRFRWTGRLTLAKYIASNTYNHYAWARSKIRKWTPTLPKSTGSTTIGVKSLGFGLC